MRQVLSAPAAFAMKKLSLTEMEQLAQSYPTKNEQIPDWNSSLSGNTMLSPPAHIVMGCRVSPNTENEAVRGKMEMINTSIVFIQQTPRAMTCFPSNYNLIKILVLRKIMSIV